ncbi:MAG: SRPBCC family protein [Ilumatobacter sp.]|jgi:hypothetical protein|uniref:SRPBCC family protein n=1 Tax=Ilumatobacter sp. TaxID=1967498 RepID=UPI00391CA826
MEIVRTLVAPCSADALYPYVEDLAVYPTWMRLVHQVEPVDVGVWDVELRARVGPFARSKRLRMARTDHVRPTCAVFERAEADGREHAPWTLRADLQPDGESSTTELTMTLRYGGGLWTGAVLERVLDDQVAAGSAALLDIVSTAR